MTDSAVRQLIILSLILRGPATISTGDIHRKVWDAGFQVSAKTTKRNINALSRFFSVMTEDGSSKPYRWFFYNFEIVEIPRLTPQLALTLSLIKKFSSAAT